MAFGYMNSMGVEDTLRTIFRRCIECEDKFPDCPECPAGKTCSLSIGTCSTCSVTSCVSDSSSVASTGTPSGPTKSGANIGGIAGGVIGGLVLVAIIVYFTWRFCIKNRRHEFAEDEWPEEEHIQNEKSADFNRRRDDRASTHTVGSIASTVFTRASNVIQIAYIPGVTNRTPPSTPGLLVPPVPPLPVATSPTSSESTPNYSQDRYLFVPDIRDSTYSGVSDSAYTRDSVAPSNARNSVATSIYRNHAVVNPLPAQTVIRAKAAVVSVKPGGPNSPHPSASSTPPLPNTDFSKYERQDPNHPASSRELRAPPSPAFSVGSTFMNSTANTATAMTARPVNVKKPSKASLQSRSDSPASESTVGRQVRPALSSAASTASRHSRARRRDPNSSLYEDTSDEDDEPGARARRSMASSGGGENLFKLINDSSNTKQSPFGDHSALPGSPLSQSSSEGSVAASTVQGRVSPAASQQSGNLNAVIKEATRRASQQPINGGVQSRGREASPFSDANEVKTP
ncbi:MAG: hypothetical protein M1825_006501 [Sarcosagium campestre]|nr:MAG: hypothetical protein M1825_006501 [Sarcosagium campestre]